MLEIVRRGRQIVGAEHVRNTAASQSAPWIPADIASNVSLNARSTHVQLEYVSTS